METTIFKPGDKVICIPGFINNHNYDTYGGAGYEEGKVFTIHSVDSYDRKDVNNVVYWPLDKDGNKEPKGIFHKACEKYSEFDAAIKLIKQEVYETNKKEA